MTDFKALAKTLNREDVQAAHEIIKPHVHKTPVVTSTTLNRIASTPQSQDKIRSGSTAAEPKLNLYFKCENLQRIGAFKARGAFHAVEKLVQSGIDKDKGVITHSSGNHAQALALAARTKGIKARIVMPTISVPQKIAATKGYGAEVHPSGSTSVEREAVANDLIAKHGCVLVPPYDHPDIVLGQGTMGLELQDQAAELTEGHKRLDAIMTPVGGGGMLSGVALSCKGTGIKVFGAEPEFEGADDVKRGFEAGKRIESVKTLTIADGLRTPMGELPWELTYEQKLVGGVYSVTEEQIVEAMRLVFERMKMVVEPSACVPLAVVLYNEEFRTMVQKEQNGKTWDLGLVFSGGNVGADALGKLFGTA